MRLDAFYARQVPHFRDSLTVPSHTAQMDDNAHRFTVTLDLYDAVVNSVRYREEGHRDDWLIGDLYIKNQALPEPPPTRIEVTVSHL